VLSGRERFWLMVEPGDVDWANHDNNLDNAIGAVLSGDAAVQVITNWVEQHSNWQDSLLIVTADHGHYLHVTQPERLTGPAGAVAR
jgi:alkaline phosphatase